MKVVVKLVVTFAVVINIISAHESCSDVVCPVVVNCEKIVTLPGECCPRCDCGYQKSQTYAYSWRNRDLGCRKCQCVGNIESCKRFQCPDPKLFDNCHQPQYDFYCGCKVKCNIDTGPRPTFPPIPI